MGRKAFGGGVASVAALAVAVLGGGYVLVTYVLPSLKAAGGAGGASGSGASGEGEKKGGLFAGIGEFLFPGADGKGLSKNISDVLGLK